MSLGHLTGGGQKVLPGCGIQVLESQWEVSSGLDQGAGHLLESERRALGLPGLKSRGNEKRGH